MKNKNIWKRWILRGLLILTVSLWLPTSVMARQISLDGTVEAGETIDRNLILSGPAVVMDGVLKGDLLAIGDKVTINGTVDGSLVVIGKTVVVNGPVAGSVYVTALDLKLGPQAAIERDISFLSLRFGMEDGASIARDLNAIGLEAQLKGSVARNTMATFGAVNLIERIYRYMQSRGWVPQAQVIQRPVSLNEPINELLSGLPILQDLAVISQVLVSQPELPLQTHSAETLADDKSFMDWATPFLRDLVSLIFLGLLGIWLFRDQVSLAEERAQAHPWQVLGTGVLVLVIGWIALAILLALILTIAFFLLWASLPALGILTGTLGLAGLATAGTLFWLSISYFSKIIISILVGTLILKRLPVKHAPSQLWSLLIGVILYSLLASVPYLGWFVTVTTTFLGLGAIWLVLTSQQLHRPSSVVSSPAAAN